MFCSDEAAGVACASVIVGARLGPDHRPI